MGLHYYNQAIAAWNMHNIEEANHLISKAFYLYPSARISDIKALFAENTPRLLADGR